VGLIHSRKPVVPAHSLYVVDQASSFRGSDLGDNICSRARRLPLAAVPLERYLRSYLRRGVWGDRDERALDLPQSLDARSVQFVALAPMFDLVLAAQGNRNARLGKRLLLEDFVPWNVPA
jgi:hypothetical protein